MVRAAASGGDRRIVLVVPTFNEEQRWNRAYWESVSRIDTVHLVFVDDGSTDGTGAVLEEFSSSSGSEIVRGGTNRGKAEAVRRGLSHASRCDPAFVGFLDADGAFPLTEVERLVALCWSKFEDDGSSTASVWSARVKLAGRDVDRKRARHYISRVLLTALAIRLKYEIYDTQSGFKIFPNTETLKRCLATPFETRWFIDLELFLRWRRLSGTEMLIWEEPVRGWRDVDGSTLRRGQAAAVARDLIRLVRAYG